MHMRTTMSHIHDSAWEWNIHTCTTIHTKLTVVSAGTCAAGGSTAVIRSVAEAVCVWNSYLYAPQSLFVFERLDELAARWRLQLCMCFKESKSWGMCLAVECVPIAYSLAMPV